MADNQSDQAPSKWEQGILQNVLMASIKEQRSARRWGIFFKAAFFLYFVALLLLIWPSNGKKVEHLKPHVGVVKLSGMISASETASADKIIKSLRKAFEATNSKAVILSINSPGGSPVQSSLMFDEMQRLKAKHPDKKLYTVIADVGASGGYFAAVGADEIYANPSSIVGSIGVLMPNFGVTELTQKIGVQQRTLTAGANKNFLDPMSPEVPAQKEYALKLLGNVHQHFIEAVKQGRGERLKDHPDTFSGLFWTGDEALKLGLIDGYGSVSSVAKDVIGVEEVVDYSEPESVFERLFTRMGATLKNALSLNLDSSQSFQLQ